MTILIGGDNFKLFKVSFAPLLGTDDRGETTRVGRSIVYCVARSASRIEAVLAACLPEALKPLASVGFDIEDVVEVPVGKRAWSVSVGPASRSYSLLIVAEDEQACERGLKKAAESASYLQRHVEHSLWQAFLIDTTKEGVC